MLTMKPEIRYMTVNDIDRVYEIETRVHSAPWSRATFQRELTGNKHNICMVAELGERIVGFVCLFYLMDEGHITNIAVDTIFQNRGIATYLMLAVVDIMTQRGVKRLTLEVRKSNTKAQHLYIKFGFKMKGIRKNYYTNNNEDALIFWTDDITSDDYKALIRDIREELQQK